MTQGSALYTGPTVEDLDRIPADLKARPQWVLWRGEDRVDPQTGKVKLNKIPIDPYTLHNADTTAPLTWGTFDQCVAALSVALEEWEQDDPSVYRGGGLGFVFAADDPYAGIDLDRCVAPETGIITAWAQTHIDALASYTEITPSGTGLHILVQGALPPKGRKKGPVEMYAYARFFTITGWHLAGTPRTIAAHQEALYEVHGRVFGPQAITRSDDTMVCYCPTCDYLATLMPTGACPSCSTPPLGAPTVMTGSTPSPAAMLKDTVLLDKARAAKNGTKFAALWSGDTAGYPSPSEADLALCIRLAFWTQDAAQIDRLFRQSGLMRTKWDEQRGAQPYGECTIAEALARQTEHYSPHRPTWGLMTGAMQHAQHGQNGSAAGPGRPTIQLDTELSRWTDEGQTALLTLTKANGAPILYQRARRIVLIATGVKPPRWLHRPPDAPVIIEASDAALYELAGMAATWQKWDKRTEEWVTILPPKLFVSTLLGRPFSPFPVLEGIVCSPTLRPDGSLLDTPGYDPDTGLYFDSNGNGYQPIPDNPDIFDAQTALKALKDALCDFLWAHNYDRSAALAAILSAVCRYTVVGNVPLFGITATARGSGKGLLADVIALIGTGRRAPLWSQAEDDAEERKRLLALGMDGDPLVCIDNVTRPLGSAPLDLALTSPTFKDRILGTQTTKEVPMHAMFLATGNNLQYVGDLARRVVPIALDPKMEKPEERTGFRYPDLLAHVAQERPRLVSAALTILKAYFVDGCPSQGLSAYGSFQPWSDLIRSALVWTGEEDPCEGRKTIEAQDPGHEALAGLLEAWHVCYPAGTKVTLKRLKQDGLDHGVGHFRPLSITRQRHLLAYHGIAMSCEGLCQVF
jgi:hypothetical protein